MVGRERRKEMERVMGEQERKKERKKDKYEMKESRR